MEKYIKLSDLERFPIRADHYDTEHGDKSFINGIETVIEYAEHLASDGWIPVTERMPKYGNRVLVAFRDNNHPVMIMRQRWYGHNLLWDSDDREFSVSPDLVVAWMSLPEPYYADEENEHETD